MLKKIFKGIGYVLLFLTLLFVIVWGLLRLPTVQTKIVDQVTESLESSLGTKVSIDRVNIKFFKTLSAEGIYLEDQKQDTLLYASALDVNIGLFDLWNNEIFLNQITLNDAFLNIYQHPSDSTLNIDFLLKSFTSDSSQDTTAGSSTSWKIGLNTINLNHTRVYFDDQVKGSKVQFNSKAFSIDMQSLDVENQVVVVDEILLEKNKITVLSTPENPLVLDTVSSPISVIFPYFDWDIQVDQLSIKETSVAYQSGIKKVSKKSVNFQDLAVVDLTVDLSDFLWQKDQVGLTIKQISCLEKSGFRINEFNGKLAFTPQQFSINNLQIKTPHTSFNNSTSLRFPTLNDLSALTEKVQIALAFKNTKIGVRDITLLAPVLGALKNINVENLNTIYLNGNVKGNTSLVHMVGTEIKVDQMFSLALDGQLSQPTNLDLMTFDLELKEFASSYQELSKILKGVNIPSGLDRFGTFRLSGKADGAIADFTASDLSLGTDLKTGFLLSGRIQDARNAENILLDINLENLTTNIEELNYLLPNGIPKNLLPLGDIAYTGNFTGGLTDMELIGDLSTDLGNLTSDLKAKFNSDYTDATYRGDLTLKAFQLNKILGDSLGIGEVTFSGKLNGSGITPETIQAEIDANIDHVIYRGYDYKNLKIDGTIDRKKFIGDFKIGDPNISFDFAGLVDLNAAIPSFKFDMNIDTVNFKALNLLDRSFSVSGILDFDFYATSINDLNGFASMTNLSVSDSTETYLADSIILFSGVDDTGKNQFSLEAPFLNGLISGDFDLEEMPTLILAYINDYFPLENYLSKSQQQVKFVDVEGKQKFDLDLQLIDITPLKMFVLPDLEYLESASVKGKFNSSDQTMSLNAEIRKLVYGENKLKKFTWNADGTNLRLTNDLLLEEITIGTNEFPEVKLANVLRQDSAFLQLDIQSKQDTIEKLLQLAAVIDRPDRSYEMRFQEQFLLNDKKWEIPTDNLIRYDGKQILINNLALQDGVHQLIINSETPENETVLLPDLTIDFDRFQIQEISSLLLPGNDVLAGTINGKVKVMQPTDNLYFTVDLDIPDLKMNKESLGAVTVDLNQSIDNATINVNINLKGDINDLTVAGKYNIGSNEFAINTDVASLEMRLLDLVLVDVISDSEGTLNGKVSVSGTPDKPNVKGTLNLKEISTLIEFTQARYAIGEGTIQLSNKTIDLGQLTLRDTANNTAQLSGTLTHDFFTDITLALDLETEQFLILNTTARDNAIFYGNLLLGAKVDVTGPLELPTVNVVANTLSGSELNLSPFAEGEVALEEDFIIFGNPDTYVKSGDSLNVYEAKASLPADITLNLELSSDALLRIIVDPTTGDQLECRGTSNLLMRFLPSGLMEMFGTYKIESGQYGFSYSEVIRKKFEIVSGGTVFFNGDPLNARFDVGAKYTTKASTYELIASEATLSNGEITQAQKQQPVSVVLNLDGSLANPVLAFDIEMPEAQGDVTNSAVTRKLAELRNNANELNKQVFGLLLINSFIVSSSSTNLEDLGENVVLSSVSKLFSNQLNNLAEKFVKGVEVNFDLSSYKSEYANDGAGGTVTELEVGITKEFLNDRLSFTAGGSLEVGTAESASQVAGDFLLTYQLNEAGNYLLKVFRRSDFDIINEENTIKTGVGISFKKSFDEEIRKKEKLEKVAQKAKEKE